MYRFGGMAMPLSVTLTIIFVLIWAAIPASVGYLANRWFKNAPLNFRLLIIWPAMWVVFEWVRGWLFTGFPWLAIGYGQVDGPLSSLAPLLGVYGVSWVVAFSAGLIVCTVINRGAPFKYITFLTSVWIGALLLSFIHWSEPYGNKLKASLVQGNVHQSIKWRPEQRQPTIDLYTRLTQDHWDSDIIIWPETALPAYYHQAKSFLEALGQAARENHTDILIGMPVADPNEYATYYNSVVTVGQHEAIYNKRHLVPFGEYIPLKSIFGNLLAFFNIPMANFSSGAIDQPLLQLAGLDIGVSICYEDVFGEEVIQALPQAKLLVNVSNDAWFGDSLSPHQHLQMAQMRSLETARPMLRATNNGVSAIIDHRGKIIAQSPQFKTDVVSAQFQPMQGSTPFSIYGNWVVMVTMFLLLIGSNYILRRSVSSNVAKR